MELPPPFPVYIQTRPEGFCYTYNEFNRKMADYQTLKTEASRILKLMKRDCIDFFNLAFMKSALENDPDYLSKISFNINQLKREGLIRFACADTFSGESTYLKQIASGAFDVVYINFNFADHQGYAVIKEAERQGLGVIAREAFMKGSLFEMAKQANIGNLTLLAHAAMKWVYSHDAVSTIVYGTGNVLHLEDSVSILTELSMSDEEQHLINVVKETALFKQYEEVKTSEFIQ